MHRHLAAVMFTDLVGYTSTVQRDEEAAREVRAEHRSVVEEALGEHGGRLLQYFGDGSLSIFPSAIEAVAAARKIQQRFLQGNRAQLRIGIELGDIAYDVQGVYGNAVNVAARLEALSSPGGVLVSGKVWQELRNHPEFDLKPLGEVALKNVEGPVSVFALRGDGLPLPPDLPQDHPIPGHNEEHASEEDTSEAKIRQAVDRIWERCPSSESLTAVGSPEGLQGVGRLPLVGREREVEELRRRVDQVHGSRGQTLFLTGDRGAGKTRLASQLAGELRDQGWLAFRGQAYATDLGVPFSPFADAFGPILGAMDRSDLQALTHNGTRELAALWPPLTQDGPAETGVGSGSGEARSRLFWTFSRFLGTMARVRPVLILLEDLQWADESTLDLLHFVVRQTTSQRVFLLCPYCGSEGDGGGRLRQVVQSLKQIGSAHEITVPLLSREAVEELVSTFFDVSPAVVGRFVNRLFEWTRGNAFFLEGTLRDLVETGQLNHQDGRWLGWEVHEWELPQTIRDAVLLRINRLSEGVRRVAELASVMGGQVTYDALRATADEPEDELLKALLQLTRRGVLTEAEVDGEVVYRFSHPLLSETLQAEVPLAVARTLHGKIARALEGHLGDRAADHVDQLAYHFARAHGTSDHGKAVQYLTAAGIRALGRNAHSEAARYLETALERHKGEEDPSREVILQALAKARISKGDQEGAICLWTEALYLTGESGDRGAAPALLRRIGKAQVSRGRLKSALEAFRQGKETAQAIGDLKAEAQLCLAEGVCLQQAGRSSRAKAEVDRALELAVELAESSLIAKVKRGLLLIHLWNGNLSLVRVMGLEVRAMAADTGDPLLMFWSEWTLAVTDGLTGNTEGLCSRVGELERLADLMRSPSLRLWATELSLEYAYASGSWDVGIGIGEQAVSLGRALHENTVLPRILVWLSLIYLGRGDLERADGLVEEAWKISGAEGVEAGADLLNVHTVVPAHIGRVAVHNAREEWDHSIRFGEAGLGLADRTGYVTWGIHRLLPLLAEAYLQNRRIPEAQATARRLRQSGETLDHGLARAWASAAEGILAWLEGDTRAGVRLLRIGAELLEEIPMVFEGTRVRRQLAGRLFELGETETALEETRRVLEVFRRLDAREEVESAVTFMREMGFDPSVSGQEESP